MVYLNVVTGFLGSGKTSVLLHLLGGASPEGRLGVVVGEFADEGYDGTRLRETGHTVRMVAGMGSRDAESRYLGELRALLEAGGHTRVFLETSGVCEAGRLVEALRGDETLRDEVRFSRTIVVVDAGAFAKHATHFPEQMKAQVGIGDLVLINKTDRVDEAQRADVRDAVRALNGRAIVRFAYMGQVSRELILAPFEAESRPLLLDTRYEDGPPPEFESFVFRSAQTCFDRVTFGHLLLNVPDRVARFKGVLRSWDRCYGVNGLPGQLDWENVEEKGDTRIALIGLGLDEARLTSILEAELTAQQTEDR